MVTPSPPNATIRSSVPKPRWKWPKCQKQDIWATLSTWADMYGLLGGDWLRPHVSKALIIHGYGVVGHGGQKKSVWGWGGIKLKNRYTLSNSLLKFQKKKILRKQFSKKFFKILSPFILRFSKLILDPFHKGI